MLILSWPRDVRVASRARAAFAPALCGLTFDPLGLERCSLAPHWGVWLERLGLSHINLECKWPRSAIWRVVNLRSKALNSLEDTVGEFLYLTEKCSGSVVASRSLDLHWFVRYNSYSMLFRLNTHNFCIFPRFPASIHLGRTAWSNLACVLFPMYCPAYE